MAPDFDRSTYASGECEIDLARRELRVRGAAVPLGARAFEVIEVLARSAGTLVTKDELMHRIWPGAIVTDNTLQVHTVAIRKALGPYRSLLKTESGRGYRLVGEWAVRRHDAAEPPRGLQRIRTDSASQVTSFPVTVTRLIGRSAVAARLSGLVSAYRAVTLTGPGGIGKTALAIKVARRILGDFPDGAGLVELASLSDPELVPSAVAQVLGIKAGSDRITAETIAHSIGNEQLLLVLDNCEHVINAAAALADVLVRQCPRISILATSREALRIDGEAVFRLPPLDVPAPGQDHPDHILGHSAVELFLARTKAQGISPDAAALPEIAEICRRLDGMPLAIEFAAALTASLGVSTVAAGLRDRFALLTIGRRNAPQRQRTLRATLDWSYELLSAAEQMLLRRLAVFPGGFTVEGAAAVIADSRFDAAAAADGIADLVAKSLVVLDPSQGAARWYLLETIRAYALGKLAEHGEADAAAGRQAAYLRDHFAPHVSGSRSSLSDEELARGVREIDNVRAALDWSVALRGDVAAGVHLTAAYAPVWLHFSLIGECRERCEHALRAWDVDPTLSARLRMELQIALGNTLIVSLGPGEQTEAVLTKAFEIATALHELNAQARILASLSAVYLYHGDYGRAQATLEQLRQVAQEIGDPSIVAVADQRIGTRLLMAGRHGEAQRCFERILAIPVSPESERPEFWHYLAARAMARALLARALCLQGFAERAHQEARTSVEEARTTDHPLSMCRVLNFGQCRIASLTGDFDVAEQAIAHSLEVAAQLKAPFWQVVGRFLSGQLLVERGDFASGLAVLRAAFDVCRETGWRVSYPEFMASLAAAHLGLGQLAEARDAVDDALAHSGPRHGQMWYSPELLRIKGQVLLGQAADQSAEDCFGQANEMAREQGALFWELRIALSVARLRISQGRHREARAALETVHDRFTDGSATSDLRSARGMLDVLPT